MATTTPRLNLIKPTVGADDDLWGDFWNQNADLLDTILLTQAQAAAAYLPVAGGVMHGALTLAGNPSGALDAATKQYVDAQTSGGPGGGPYLPLSGGVLSGPLILAGDPGQPLAAATKQYVDAHAGSGGAFLPISGGTLTGPLTLAADPATALGAATKQYVDGHAPAGGPYLPLGGGILTGVLTLAGDPAAALSAATKQYVDAHVPAGGPFLPLSGGQMTGPITVTSGTGPLVLTNGPLIPTNRGVGTNILFVSQTGGNARFLFDGYASNPIFAGRASQGTPAVPSATLANQTLVGIQGFGYGSTAYGGVRGSIQISAAEQFTDAAQGSYIAFLTATIGSVATNVERLRITDTGALQFAITGPSISVGAGAPIASAPVASLFLRSDAAAGSQIYLNTDGATNWQPLAQANLFLPLAGGTISGPVSIPSQNNPLIVTANPVLPAPNPAQVGTLLLFGADGQNCNVQLNGFGNNCNIIGARYQNTSGAPQAVPATLVLLNLGVKGYTGTKLSGIYPLVGLRAAEAWTDVGNGTYTIFSTVAVGTTSAVERLRITDAGALQFATTGPLIQTGAGAPAAAAPAGSIWLRTDGAAGTRIYISQGATWLPIAGV